MAFAELLDQVGGFGRFQILQNLAIFIPLIIISAYHLVENFAAAVPDHRCRVHILDNTTFPVNTTSVSPSLSTLQRVYIPLGPDQRPETCRRFLHPQWQLLHLNETDLNASQVDTEPCLEGWVYDQGIFASTIVTEWDLVCESLALKMIPQVTYMTGILTGSIMWGYLSDRFGRKMILTACYLIMTVGGSSSAFASSLIFYCAFRSLTGFAVGGVLIVSLPLLIEWTQSQSRTVATTVLSSGYSIGVLLLSGMAYFIRDWQMLHLALVLPCGFFFLYSWWMAESARWLLISGKLDSALRELQRVARINGKKEAGEMLTLEVLRGHLQGDPSTGKSHSMVLDLFRTPKLRRIVFCVSFVWFFNLFSYFGLVMDLQNLDTNIYLLSTLFGAVDLPAKVAAYLMLRYSGGRNRSLVVFQVLAGLSILASMFVPAARQSLRVIFVVFAAACLSSGITCIFTYSMELYPTMLRMTAMGTDQVAARLGCILGPVFKIVGLSFPSLPYIVYGVFLLISSMGVFLLLPETQNMPLPDTIQDVENNWKKSRHGRRQKKAIVKSTQF